MTTILVDSVQVYREVPIITNQARTRPSELTGVISVAEEWTVARHKELAERIIGSLPHDVPFVLDAGTGMYLNALLLDFPLSPKAPAEVRAEAWKLAAGTENPRREARKLELTLMGLPERSSIWDAPLRYDTTFLYLRPERIELDSNISERSARIVRQGVEEAQHLLESGIMPNPSAREAIGVKEMLLHASGDLSATQAEETISSRTRRLARRQIRWFDKLVRSLPQETPVLFLDSPRTYPRSTDIKGLEEFKHIIHDILE